MGCGCNKKKKKNKEAVPLGSTVHKPMVGNKKPKVIISSIVRFKKKKSK